MEKLVKGKKRKTKKYWILSLSIFAILVLIGYFTIIGYFLQRNYRYSNYNATFTYAEDKLKGIPYTGRDNSFRSFLRDNPNVEDKTLYRTFTVDIWRFWEWREMIIRTDRFLLPYISTEEIMKNRAQEHLPDF